MRNLDKPTRSTASPQPARRREPGHNHPILGLWHWGPALALMVLIFALSSQSELGDPHWLSKLLSIFLGGLTSLAPVQAVLAWLDKASSWIGHFVIYAGLAVAYAWGLRRQWPLLPITPWLAWGMALLYGLSDEFHQSFVPNRQPDPLDVLTDCAGAAVALLLIAWLDSRRKTQREP